MSDYSDDGSAEKVGKGRPPISSRFKPGQSGNPNGRPRGKQSAAPYEIVLGQMVTVRENGLGRTMRADEAFLLQLANKGLAGGGIQARAALNAVENMPPTHGHTKPRQIIYDVYADPGDLKHALVALEIAVVLDRFRPTARLALEAGSVQAALARLGERQLTVEEQAIVVAATRLPHKVRWPGWWTV